MREFSLDMDFCLRRSSVEDHNFGALIPLLWIHESMLSLMSNDADDCNAQFYYKTKIIKASNDSDFYFTIIFIDILSFHLCPFVELS